MADATPTSTGSLLAGAAAATIVDTLIFPLDTIKTRSQAVGGLARNGGYAGLWRGLGAVVLCTVPSASVFFWTYERGKALAGDLLGGGGADDWRAHLAASAAAEMVSCAVLTPAEMVKQRAQVDRSGVAASAVGGAGARGRTLAILRDLLRGPGRAGALAAGYAGLVARNVPVTAVQFVLYEDFKTRYRRRKAGRRRGDDDTGAGAGAGKGTTKLTALESGLCAGASGSIAAAITTPMDVLKTRVMLQGDVSGGDKKSGAATGRKSLLQLGRTMVREEGVRSLFRGIGLRVVWTSLGLSLYLGSYEAMKEYIDG